MGRENRGREEKRGREGGEGEGGREEKEREGGRKRSARLETEELCKQVSLAYPSVEVSEVVPYQAMVVQLHREGGKPAGNGGTVEVQQPIPVPPEPPPPPPPHSLPLLLLLSCPIGL